MSLDQAANAIPVASRKVEPTSYAVCIGRGTTRLDVNKKICEMLEIRKASFADVDMTASMTGMLIGGVVAIGVHDLPHYMGSAVLQRPEVVTGGAVAPASSGSILRSSGSC